MATRLTLLLLCFGYYAAIAQLIPGPATAAPAFPRRPQHVKRRELRESFPASNLPAHSSSSAAWVPGTGWVTIMWLQPPPADSRAPAAGTPQKLTPNGHAEMHSGGDVQAPGAAASSVKGQVRGPSDPGFTAPAPGGAPPTTVSKRAGSVAMGGTGAAAAASAAASAARNSRTDKPAAASSTSGSLPAISNAASVGKPSNRPAAKASAPTARPTTPNRSSSTDTRSVNGTSSSNAARPQAQSQPKTPAGVWRSRDTTVAGAPGAAAVSGLTGPPPYLLKQPGAVKTLHIGCLSERELPRDLETMAKDVPDLTYEAMKLALQDFAPTLKPPVNIKLTCFETECGEMAAVYAMQLLAQQDALAVVSSTSTSMGLNSMGVVVEDNAYGQGVSFYFMASFSAQGGDLPEVYTFQPGAGDAKAALEVLQSAKTASPHGLDGVFVAVNSLTFYTDFLRAVDKSSLDVPVLAAGGAATSTEIVHLFKDDLGVLKRVTLVISGPGTEDFRARLKAAVQNHDGLDSSSDTGPAYDAMTTLLKAYAVAAELKSGVEVAQQIPKQRFVGVTGPIVFDSKGDLIPNNGTFLKATHDPENGEVQYGPPLPLPQSNSGDVAD